MQFQIVARTGHPDLLDLPWDLPLACWDTDRLVEVARGIHRHVVRFVNYDGRLYALKELPQRLAEREYRLLSALAHESVPVVEVVGTVVGRTGRWRGDELEAVLITRHLEFSLPYRVLFTNPLIPDLRRHLLDALAQLLVRLHLTGFFWGDCSLSNTLFRRDAGALAAYLVDAETGELHPRLSDGQRRHDLAAAEMNVVGELIDIAAELESDDGLDPAETADEIRRRYEDLWSELTRDEVFGQEERYRVDARLRRLNDLGFDVEEVSLQRSDDGLRLHLDTQVVEPGHHRRRLLGLTGLDVQENQARRLLHDMAGFGCMLSSTGRSPVPEAARAFMWLTEVFWPAINAVPAELREKLDPAELYHQILEHRWFLSESSGRDVGLQEAVASYVDGVLRFVPDERALLLRPPGQPSTQSRP